MIDLNDFRSLDRTAWDGRLQVPMYNGQREKCVFVIVSSGLYLYEMHWMHGPGHSEVKVKFKVRGYMYNNKH